MARAQKNEVLLGLDISSSSTGWAVFRDGEFRPEDREFGVIQPPRRYCLEERLFFFKQQLLEILNRFEPTRVAAEAVHLRWANAAMKLSQFSGVQIQTCFEWDGIVTELITASEARALANTGQNKPSAYLNMVQRYNLEGFKFSTHNDITDAIVVGLGTLARNLP